MDKSSSSIIGGISTVLVASLVVWQFDALFSTFFVIDTAVTTTVTTNDTDGHSQGDGFARETSFFARDSSGNSRGALPNYAVSNPIYGNKPQQHELKHRPPKQVGKSLQSILQTTTLTDGSDHSIPGTRPGVLNPVDGQNGQAALPLTDRSLLGSHSTAVVSNSRDGDGFVVAPTMSGDDAKFWDAVVNLALPDLSNRNDLTRLLLGDDAKLLPGQD